MVSNFQSVFDTPFKFGLRMSNDARFLPNCFRSVAYVGVILGKGDLQVNAHNSKTI